MGCSIDIFSYNTLAVNKSNDIEDIMKLCFIGAGKMATAIARGLVINGVYESEEICASDIFEQARIQFSDVTGCSAIEDNKIAVSSADTIILAVKPQNAEAVLSKLEGLLDDKLIISIAAGLKISKLQAWTGSERVIRVMPNTPSMVNKGASVYSPSSEATENDKAIADKIFNTIGIAYEMDESKLDAVTALSGSGPAFVFAYVEAMVAAAEKLDLEPYEAQKLLVQTIAGAAKMLEEEIGSPAELREAVTSKGGTTHAGLESLRQNNFDQVLYDCLKAAHDRSIELGFDG